MKRAHDLEILDGPVRDRAEYERSLAQVADVNRWLGGDRSLRRSLAPLLAMEGPVRVLDVGAGNGDVAMGVARWAAARGRNWRVTAVDLSAEAAAVAARRVRAAGGARSTGHPADGGRDRGAAPVGVVRANGLRLPFPDRAFDAAFTVLTFHHFDDTSAVALLREMARVVRRLVVVNDLERSRGALLGAQALAATVWRANRITRNDGPLSVRRSFTPSELRALGRLAGLRNVRVARRVAFRLVLEAEP